MKKVMGDTNSNQRVLGAQVSAKIAGFLSDVEKEPVPDRLTDLALELQHSLAQKLELERECPADQAEK